ncbi:hypothetical protein ALC56_01984 [Trachymyrmex septentrionalis]|uniref:Uncharacterized protein n=1 Tax=Trachymyrmex septentrionalis TaxID=34720 RepID=A0A195FTV7_9HYME|nr:hypothetical protein ALC56_01984 [Trachymyrmex septentrionalis]
MVLVIHNLFANARKGASKRKNATSERYRESRVEKPLQRYSLTILQGFTNLDVTWKFALEQVYRIAEKNARTHRSSVNNGVCIKYVSSRYRKSTGLVNSLPFFCNLTVTVTHPKSAITLRSASKLAARLVYDISNFFHRSTAHMMREVVTMHKLHYRETERDGEYTMTSLLMGMLTKVDSKKYCVSPKVQIHLTAVATGFRFLNSRSKIQAQYTRMHFDAAASSSLNKLRPKRQARQNLYIAITLE